MTARRATNVDGAKNFIRDTQPACRWTQLAIQLSFSSWTYRVFIGAWIGVGLPRPHGAGSMAMRMCRLAVA